MSFGFGIGDFVTVYELVMKVKNFLNDIEDAPRAWNGLKAEADCLGICLKVVRYKQSRRVLRYISKGQRDDLLTIINGCDLNMAELIGFVAQTQSIAVAEHEKQSGEHKPRGFSLTRWIKKLATMGKNLWTKMEFVWQEKQPMREKLAIPTQSLNIFLVSLTYISLSYNGRLAAGPNGGGGGSVPVPPTWTESWDVVGTKVAFKDVDFDLKQLIKPGIEDAIIECAERKINGEGDKGGGGKGKKPGGSGAGSISIKAPQRPRRKSSFNRRNAPPDPDGLFLVRPAKARASSRVRTSSSVELVKADYSFESDSGSSSVGFDGEYISPRGPRSPTRGGGRGGGGSGGGNGGGGGGGAYFGDRSPPRRPSGRPNIFHPYVEDGGLNDSDEDFEGEEIELLDVEKEGYRRARVNIKRSRKSAIREMEQAVIEEAEASSYPSRETYMRSTAPGQPDVRAYMETRYGIVINLASPDVEAINRSELNTRTASYTSKPARRNYEESKLKETMEETRHRSRIGEHLCDSEVSSETDSDSDRPIKLTLGPEPRMGKEKMKRESTIHRTELFTIPNTEYIPRTETFESRTSSTGGGGDRQRERFIRQQEVFITRREEELERREAVLRERELELRERERVFNRRRESPSGARGSMYDRYREGPTLYRAATERPDPRYRENIDLTRTEEGIHRVRRADSYVPSAPSELVIRPEHVDSDDESMYGRSVRRDPPPPPSPPPERRRRETRRRNDESDSDDGKMYIRQPMKY